MTPNELSFLPDDYLERKAQRRTNAICAMLFLIVMVAIGTAFSITEKSTKEVERQHDAVDREYAEAAKRIQQVQRMQDKQRTMAHQAELTASLLEKVPRSRLLADITNALPSGVSLMDFTMDAKKRPTSAAVAAAAAAAAPKTAFETKRAAMDAKGTTVTPGSEPRVYDVTMKLTGLASTDVQVS